MKRSLVVLLTIAFLLFAFAGMAVAAEQDDAAARLYNLGIIEGYPDGSMGLERQITRAEFAKISVMAKGQGEAAALLQGSSSQYSDVQVNVWYTGFINVASAQGIVKGYPDGTFRPNDNISNAEAVTMILRVLGYNDNLPGSWPTNYLVKGADLGITSGVVTNASANALRGDVFTMLNRALDKDVVFWGTVFGQTDAVDFQLKGWTLLQEKLNAKLELEGRVVANFRTDSSLKEDQLRIGSTKVTLKTMDDVDWLLGLEVKALHNADAEVAYVEIKTSAANIIFDTIAEAKMGEAKLLVADKTYKYADDYIGFVNFADPDDYIMSLEDAKGLYAKIVLKDNKIAFGSAFKFDAKDAGVVQKVDGTVVVHVDADSKDVELDLADFDAVYVFDAWMKTVDAELSANDVVYAWANDDDELFVVVAGKVVEGVMDRVRTGDARVDGVTYKTAPSYSGFSSVSDNDNKNIVPFDATGDRTLNLVGEEVTLILDINNRIRHIVGDAQATSGAMYGLVVDAYRSGTDFAVTIFDKEGKKVAYSFKERADWVPFYNHFEDEGAFGVNVYVPVKFELNRDGKIASIWTGWTDWNEWSPGMTTDGATSEFVMFNDGPNYVDVDGTRWFIGANTIIMKYNAADPDNQKESIVSWNSVKGTDGELVIAVAGAAGKNAAFIVIMEGYGNLTADDIMYGIVTENTYYNGDDYITTVDVAGKGINEYVFAGADFSLTKGTVIAFELNSAGELTVTDAPLVGFVEDRDGSFLKIFGQWWLVDADAVIYKTDSNGALDGKTSISSLKGYNVELLLDGDNILQAIKRLDQSL